MIDLKIIGLLGRGKDRKSLALWLALASEVALSRPGSRPVCVRGIFLCRVRCRVLVARSRGLSEWVCLQIVTRLAVSVGLIVSSKVTVRRESPGVACTEYSAVRLRNFNGVVGGCVN